MNIQKIQNILLKARESANSNLGDSTTPKLITEALNELKTLAETIWIIQQGRQLWLFESEAKAKEWFEYCKKHYPENGHIRSVRLDRNENESRWD